MIYLAASILAMGGLAVVLRLAMGQSADAVGVNAVYRGTAAVIVVVVAAASVDWPTFHDLLALTGPRAALGSLLFFLTGLAGVKAVQLGHLGITWTVLRCSMILPVLASILVWREVPLHPISSLLLIRLAGIALVLAAIALMGADHMRRETGSRRSASAGSRPWAWLAWLTLAFMAQGAWEIALRATRSLPSDQTRVFFMAIVIAGAFCFSLPAVGIARARLGRRELLYGGLAGLLSLLASGCRIWALRDLDGILVFPVTTIGTVLLVQALSMAIWQEKTGTAGWLGFAFAVVGVLLLALPLPVSPAGPPASVLSPATPVGAPLHDSGISLSHRGGGR